MEQIYAAALQKAASLGAMRIRALADHFGSFEAVWRASVDELKSTNVLGTRQLEIFLASKKEIDPEIEFEKLQRAGVKILTYRDEFYPPLLAECANPPAVLSYRGKWFNSEKTLAIVGSRKPTPYGINACRYFAEALASQGVVIVSGGARGIDSVGHEAALNRSRTIAVLACGLDVVYPPENKKLFDEIAEKGLLISEYALGTRPLGRQFPARNRIISGLSRGVLVVEAAQRSGTLITADFALEEGRDVFAIPGSVFSEMSKGTHHLLRQGAIFAGVPDDILREYDWGEALVESTSKRPTLSPEEELVLKFCKLESAVDIDTIIAQSAYTPAQVNYLLLQLELKGLIKNIGNQRYMEVAKG